MKSVEEALVPIRGNDGAVAGELEIALLPRSPRTGTPPLVKVDEAECDPLAESVQLLEAREYRYTVRLAPEIAGAVEADQPEVLTPYEANGRVGLLRPREAVGTLALGFRIGGQDLGRALVEVRSHKLSYLDEYRWMLNDLASWATETLLQGFAPSSRALAVGETEDARTLYQRFAFISAQLTNEAGFGSAIAHVLARPHQHWEELSEGRPAGAPIKADSRTIRDLTRGGPKVPWSEGPSTLPAIPRQLEVRRSEPTFDTPPNRFVKFALTHWRSLVAELADALEDRTTAVATRGSREAAAVLDRLDALLAEPIFREISDLTDFPSGDQTLQKREGYRHLFRLFLLTELASTLNLEGAPELFSASSRDIATLYEYWCFLQLAAVVADVSGAHLDESKLLSETDRGLTLGLRQGKQAHVSGVAERSGRRLGLALFFNRTFASQVATASTGSWSRQMRPDCSLLVRPLTAGESFRPLDAARDDDVWLHFDAKYRLDRVVEQFGPPPEDEAAEADLAAQEEQAESRGTSRREDLLKMHAYRDAIRRSAGAYVLYPGDVGAAETLREYHEVLPGLGAFALRPANEDRPVGTAALSQFIEDVLQHLATQVSERERARFWEARSYKNPATQKQPPGAVDFLTQPPDDTDVLLGYVRPEQWPWVKQTGLYNLRADEGRRGSIALGGRELGAQLVLLYGEDGVTGLFRPGARQIATAHDLRQLGYPRPGGELYVLLSVEAWIDQAAWPGWLETHQLAHEAARVALRYGRPHGAPAAVSWRDLAAWALPG